MIGVAIVNKWSNYSFSDRRFSMEKRLKKHRINQTSRLYIYRKKKASRLIKASDTQVIDGIHIEA